MSGAVWAIGQTGGLQFKTTIKPLKTQACYARENDI